MKLAALVVVAFAGCAFGQLTPTGPFTGQASEGFEGHKEGSHCGLEMFGGHGWMGEVNGGCAVIVSSFWAFGCKLESHEGKMFSGSKDGPVYIKFDPPLTPAQHSAAEQLVYARISKNSVVYGERFWKDEDFSLVSDLTSHYYFHSTQNQAGTPGILTAYAIGEKADVLASQSDARRMRIVAGDLTAFDDRAPGLARNIISYAWQRDPYTDGAYALYKPGQWFGIRPILQRPHGKVLFAGEHLADWQGFMEGAIETGEGAAASLIRG